MDQRQSPRAHVLQRAKVVFRRGFSSIDCVVLDLSNGGARLKFFGLLGVPERFELRFDNGVRREVEIRYRGIQTTGVAFVDDLAA